eukprot:scaffold35472_cov31-Tisochrysis_lutea.AAC.8
MTYGRPGAISEKQYSANHSSFDMPVWERPTSQMPRTGILDEAEAQLLDYWAREPGAHLHRGKRSAAHSIGTNALNTDVVIVPRKETGEDDCGDEIRHDEVESKRLAGYIEEMRNGGDHHAGNGDDGDSPGDGQLPAGRHVHGRFARRSLSSAARRNAGLQRRHRSVDGSRCTPSGASRHVLIFGDLSYSRRGLRVEEVVNTRGSLLRTPNAEFRELVVVHDERPLVIKQDRGRGSSEEIILVLIPHEVGLRGARVVGEWHVRATGCVLSWLDMVAIEQPDDSHYLLVHHC